MDHASMSKIDEIETSYRNTQYHISADIISASVLSSNVLKSIHIIYNNGVNT